MAKVTIEQGGKMGDFNRGGKLASIQFAPCDVKSMNIHLYLETSEGQDNLSYLTLEEAVQLKAELEKAIRETIEQFEA